MGVIGLKREEIAARKIWINAKHSIQMSIKISEFEQLLFYATSFANSSLIDPLSPDMRITLFQTHHPTWL